MISLHNMFFLKFAIFSHLDDITIANISIIINTKTILLQIPPKTHPVILALVIAGVGVIGIKKVWVPAAMSIATKKVTSRKR